VRNGRIGEVHTVRVGLPQGNNIDNRGTQPAPIPEGFDYDMWLGPAPWRPYNPSRCHRNFRWISDYSGGRLTDWAGHHCDIANWGMNTELSAPVEIAGKAIFPSAQDGCSIRRNRIISNANTPSALSTIRRPTACSRGRCGVRG